MLVDNIMLLTGSYNSKPKPEERVVNIPVVEQNKSPQPQPEKPRLFPDLSLQPILEAKNFNSEISPLAGLERTFTRTKTLDLFTESPGVKIPNAMGGGNYSRQGSISNFFSSFPLLNRQNSLEFFDELNRKLLKQETLNFSNFGNNASAMNEEMNETNQAVSIKKETSNFGSQRNTILKQGDMEELMNMTLPILSKKSSNVSQQAQEEVPVLSRFPSTFSFLQ